MLDPAAASEADRRVPVGRPERSSKAQAGAARGRRGCLGGVSQRGHIRVPDGFGRALLLPRSERAAAGRASRHRDGDRHRHCQGADSRRVRGPVVVPARGRDLDRSCAGVSDQAESSDTFRPSPGVIKVFNLAGGPGIRIDTAAHPGCTISPHYDSLVAKVIAHGSNRDEAVARMRRALQMTVIEGIQTSVPLHLRILDEPDFFEGRLSTAFIGRFALPP